MPNAYHRLLTQPYFSLISTAFLSNTSSSPSSGQSTTQLHSQASWFSSMLCFASAADAMSHRTVGWLSTRQKLNDSQSRSHRYVRTQRTFHVRFSSKTWNKRSETSIMASWSQSELKLSLKVFIWLILHFSCDVTWSKSFPSLHILPLYLSELLCTKHFRRIFIGFPRHSFSPIKSVYSIHHNFPVAWI